MPLLDAKSAAYEALSDNDLSLMAMQLYQFHLKNPNKQSANVVYKTCAFEIDLAKGNVVQQFVKIGAVNSLIKPDTANEYANQLKQAHHMAAMIAVVESIKSIKDNPLQTELANITKKNPAMAADQVLIKLRMGQASSLVSFGLFNRTAFQAKSPALTAVRKVLDSEMNNLTTLGAADNVCKQITNELQANARPELKR